MAELPNGGFTCILKAHYGTIRGRYQMKGVFEKDTGTDRCLDAWF